MKAYQLRAVVVMAFLILLLVVILDPGRDPGLLVLLFGGILVILGIPTAVRIPGLSSGDRPSDVDQKEQP